MVESLQQFCFQVVTIQLVLRLIKAREQDRFRIRRPAARMERTRDLVHRQVYPVPRSGIPYGRSIVPAPARCNQQPAISRLRRERTWVDAGALSVPEFGDRIPADRVKRLETHIEAAGSLGAGDDGDIPVAG